MISYEREISPCSDYEYIPSNKCSNEMGFRVLIKGLIKQHPLAYAKETIRINLRVGF